MIKKKTQTQINKTDNILRLLWELFKGVILDVFKQLKDLFFLFLKNIKGHWTRKLATIIVIYLTIYPLYDYYSAIIRNTYIHSSNIINKEEIFEKIQTDYEIEIMNFFEEYNRKYSVDCDWINRVNVDQNMFLKWGTLKKPRGVGCVATEKWQWLPITIEKPLKDETNQIIKVRGKAVLVVSNGGVVTAIEKNDFELWRQWADPFWRFNPTTGKQRYRPL